MNVRVRIAPSPTGFAHIGTAYMGLFNWAFAKKMGGTFILRLEDTDQKRHVEEAEQAIYDALDWLDLRPDESPIKEGSFGPYRQSERLDLYREKAEQLKHTGAAYEKEGAVWLKIPTEGTLTWDDAVRGKIEFAVENLKDWVILKSDGYPTYNFANVIDDMTMQISHVLRGEEHISNTPLQLSAYKALGLTPPTFAHLPVLRSLDHKKLSKRRDPVSLQWFREQGYLPEAILNFLALQGWSHPEEKDIFSKEEFSKLLTLERVKTSAPVFDFKKLDWLNGQYIRQTDDNKLISLVLNEHHPKQPEETVKRLLPVVKDRLRKLNEFDELTTYFSTAPTVEKSLLVEQSKKDEKEIKDIIDQTIYSFESLNTWSVQELDKAGHEILEKTGWKPKELFMTIRVALSGRTATPPLSEVMNLLGKQETLQRLKTARASL